MQNRQKKNFRVTVARFFIDYDHIWWGLGFLCHALCYFFCQTVRAPQWMVHCALDDWIPFCAWFVIPYVLWFFYVAFFSVYFLFTSRECFIRMMLFLCCGMGLTILFYLVCPTGIDFRPEPEALQQEGILWWLLRFLFDADNPSVVCPSIHCYNAIGVHLTICYSPLKKKRWLRIGSFVLVVLICLSTMFIKQHSFIDFCAAVGISVPFYAVAFCVNWPFLQKRKGANSPHDLSAQ